MLETERFDRESDNDDRPARAGHSAEVTQDPAEVGQGQDAADPGSKEAGGRSRGLFRRGRRTATRPVALLRRPAARPVALLRRPAARPVALLRRPATRPTAHLSRPAAQ